jgi:hypothetical protein
VERSSLELQERFFIEHDQIQLRRARQIGLAQAIVDCIPRESGVVFFPGEALFLGRRKNFAIADQARGAVMIKGRNAEDVHGWLARNFASSFAAIS